MLNCEKEKTDEEVHRPSKRYLDALKLLEKSKISSKNKDLIKEFVEACIADGIGKLRISLH